MGATERRRLGRPRAAVGTAPAARVVVSVSELMRGYCAKGDMIRQTDRLCCPARLPRLAFKIIDF